MNEILMIDDSKAFCESVVELLEDEKDWNVEYCLDGAEGIKILQEKEFNVVLLDLKMPGMNGLEVLQKLTQLHLIKKNYIIVLTGEITIENAVSSLQYGASDFIQKPFVAEYPEHFISRIEKGFVWQEERLVYEKLKNEKQEAILESQLITKSVGHDMSGSYYGSLMLRLQMLNKRSNKMSNELEDEIIPMVEQETDNEELRIKLEKMQVQTLKLNKRIEDVIELMKFFKELGEKLKHLGSAISIDSKHEKVVSLSKVLKSALRIFTDTLVEHKDNIDLVEDYDPKELEIFASEEDLVRVFLNLIENAIKAMGDVGTLTVKTYKKGKKAIAEVIDTGCGIPADKLHDIWRPDFTFWKNTTGTGLGLMICKKAIENSGGEIFVESVEGEGTKFIIKFDLKKRAKA